MRVLCYACICVYTNVCIQKALPSFDSRSCCMCVHVLCMLCVLSGCSISCSYTTPLHTKCLPFLLSCMCSCLRMCGCAMCVCCKHHVAVFSEGPPAFVVVGPCCCSACLCHVAPHTYVDNVDDNVDDNHDDEGVAQIRCCREDNHQPTPSCWCFCTS